MSASEGNTPGSLSEPEDLSPGASPQKHDDEEEEAGDDLFGDGEDEALDDEADVAPARRRQLDDEELDSGDDENRKDRQRSEGVQSDGTAEELRVQTGSVGIPRHAIPQPSDHELSLLKVPMFLSFEPTAYNHKDFQPPVTDHHSKSAPSSSFSAYNTALTTIRWRHSPSNPSELQSNARLLRWSDGSLTMQFASTPTSQFELTANALCRPPHKSDSKHRPLKRNDNKENSFSYLVAASPSAGFLRVTNRVTLGLQVAPSGDTADEALQRLQSSIAAAKRGSIVESSEAMAKINLIADPEIEKRQAEAAEREKLRAQRRIENAMNKERERSNRVFSRTGYGGRAAMTIGDLEGGDGRPRANRAKPRRRRPEYSSDEEDFGRRFTKEDEYDEEDEFIAPSDEEEAVGDDDEEDIDDGIDEEPPARKRASPKRAAVVEDRDAEGEDDDEIAAPRGKRRRVIESDDEE